MKIFFMNTDAVKNSAWPHEGGVLKATPPVSTHKLSKVTHATSWVEALRRGIRPAQILTAVSGSIGGTAVVSEGHRSDGIQIPSIDGTC